MAVDESFHLTDAQEFGSFQFHRHPIALFGGTPTIDEIIQIELEFREIFVFLVGCGFINAHLLLLLVHHIGCYAIVPRSIARFVILHFLSLIANVACRFVDADDVHIVVQRRPLRPEHHLVGSVEYFACLFGIRGILCCGIHTGYEQQQQNKYHPSVRFSHSDTDFTQRYNKPNTKQNKSRLFL